MDMNILYSRTIDIVNVVVLKPWDSPQSRGKGRTQRRESERELQPRNGDDNIPKGK